MCLLRCIGNGHCHVSMKSSAVDSVLDCLQRAQIVVTQKCIMQRELCQVPLSSAKRCSISCHLSVRQAVCAIASGGARSRNAHTCAMLRCIIRRRRVVVILST